MWHFHKAIVIQLNPKLVPGVQVASHICRVTEIVTLLITIHIF